MITKDSLQLLKKQMILKFEEGNQKFVKGTDLQTKEEGMKAILCGMKLLQQWIDRETDPTMKENLVRNYKAKYQDLEEKMKIIEEYQKGGVTNNSAFNGKGKASETGTGPKAGGEKDDDSQQYQNALLKVIASQKLNIKWTDIAGLEQAKKAIQEYVILPIKFPQFFTGQRIYQKGILLYGPPGTGKTLMVKACATEADCNFFQISAFDLISKYRGESEKLIKALFVLAREKKPSIIFIDEIDLLCGGDDSESNCQRFHNTEFLVQMEEVEHDDRGVLVLGATNLPWALDSAIRRRQLFPILQEWYRFKKRIYIPLPDFTARHFMVKHNLKDTFHNLSEEQIKQIAEKIDGFSGSDITILVREAVMEPIRCLEVLINGAKKYQPASDSDANMPGVKKVKLYELKQSDLDIPTVTLQHFESAIKRSKASVSKDLLKKYAQFTSDFGEES